MNYRERILQHSDERTPTPGRPSLLSSDQQVEADRNRILSELDGVSGSANSRARRTSNAWIVAIVAVLTLGVGGAVWLADDSDKQIVVAKSDPLAVPDAMRPPETVDLATPNYEMGESSTAAVLEDMPLVATPPSPPLEPMVLASAPPPVPMVVAGDTPPPAAVAAPARAPAATPPAKVTAARAAKKARPQAPAAAPSPKKKAEAEAAAVPQGDKDVALLAALVTHSKSTQTRRNGALAARLKQCKASATVRAAAQCRAKVCAGSARGERECRAGAAKSRPGS